MIPTHLNPYSRAIKKYMLEVLQEGYTTKVDETIDRIVHHMVTKQDAENVISFLGNVYQAGYNQAIQAAEAAIESKGFKFKITPPPSE